MPDEPRNGCTDFDKESIVALLNGDGPISRALKGFETREQQKEMLRNILDAYTHNGIAIIEAGTGTGKSMAYLIPAIAWALQKKERTLISTNTINLQEQLIHKDIPLLLKALNVDVKAVLVKGMSNYLCKRKLQETQYDVLHLTPFEKEELEKIHAWEHTTKDGSRASLPFVPSLSMWEKTCAESDTCNHQQCEFYQDCHFFKARKQAAEAQLLISNHHLLFADLASRAANNNYENPAILPVYTKVILDEAHHIEDVATEYFASQVSRLDMMRTMGRIASEKQGKDQGKLPVLKERLIQNYPKLIPQEATSLIQRFNLDLPGIRKDLIQQINDTFQAYDNFILQMTGPQNSGEEGNGDNKLRILPMHHTHPQWIESLIPYSQRLTTTMQKYAQSLISIEKDYQGLANEKLMETTKGVRFELLALVNRLIEASETLTKFTAEKQAPSKVRWIETQPLKTINNTHLVNAELDISLPLANFLFQKFDSVILCSATLTSNKQFDFFRKRVGLVPGLLKDKIITENIYDSPFNYTSQGLFAIPTDIPNPTDPAFMPAAIEKIAKAIQASKGNAFVLFTSYTMMKQCYDKLHQKLRDGRYNVLKQGDDNRQELLNQFKKVDRSVLFGTDSFWEGVDVAGEALRCVIIVKLPFKVPTEPIIQARTEAISARGGDPFMEYSLPNAIVKFKQGVGRLIRNKKDRGCVICLDSRLVTKRYGRLFLNSLPPFQQVLADGEMLHKQMTDFYKSTNPTV